MFNLNRETSDTTAFNCWSRRTYVLWDEDKKAPRLVPAQFNRWHRNFILNRDYYGVRDGNGNGLRCDDGASWFNMSTNVLYGAGMQVSSY